VGARGIIYSREGKTKKSSGREARSAAAIRKGQTRYVRDKKGVGASKGNSGNIPIFIAKISRIEAIFKRVGGKGTRRVGPKSRDHSRVERRT